jgi:hypothetical protein
MRTTARLRREAGSAVCDGGRTVVQAGRDLGLTWPVVQGCVSPEVTGVSVGVAGSFL